MENNANYLKLVKSIALRIRRLRQDLGLTQEDMAEYGFNYRHYQKLESGTYSPNLRTLYRLAKVFGVPVRDLFI
jgi:DNA-binding XRE family transcriptional regulator